MAIDQDKMEALLSAAKECSVELTKIVNGSVVEVKLSSPVLKPSCWMVLKNGCFHASVHLKPAAKRDRDIYRLVTALWESLFSNKHWRSSAAFPYEDVHPTKLFAIVRGKFLDAAAPADKVALRQVMDKNKQEQHRQMLEFARTQFKQISRELLRRGASLDEVQAILNEVVVEGVHEV